MRILMLNYEYPPLGGGGGIASKKIAEGFVELGHEVDCVTTNYKGLRKKERINGVNIHRVNVLNRDDTETASIASMMTFPIASLPKCIQLCRNHEYDFINTHFAVPSGPVGIAIAALFDIKHVLSIHGGDIYDPTKAFSPHKKWYLRKTVETVIDSSDHVIAQSTDTRNNATKYYDVESDIHVIPLPYEPHAFPPASRQDLGLNPDAFYLVAVGRLVERKGFNKIIRALPELNEEICAVIIGDGPKKAELEHLSQRLAVDERVTLTGYVSDDKKFQYLSNSDAYVLSSLHEGFGICLQEAMQVGLPIVATNHGGQTDLVADGENGFLVPVDDQDALVAAIDELWNSKAETMSEVNKQKIKSFQPTNICNQIIELVDSR